MLLEKKAYEGLHPCAGITLIRFYGFDLRFPPVGGKHPGKLKSDTNVSDCAGAKIAIQVFYPFGKINPTEEISAFDQFYLADAQNNRTFALHIAK